MARSSDSNPRALVREVLPRAMADRIWSASYRKVLPVDLQDFDLQDVLPAVFYLFRYGFRRGKGRFLDAFSPPDLANLPERRRKTTAKRIASVLSRRPDLDGFRGETEQAVLADLLLCFCVQNARRALGRDQQVQRVAPTHFFASWIDLPASAASLRHVPEMLTAVLANQEGPSVERTVKGPTWFAVANPRRSAKRTNLLLEPFTGGMQWSKVGADLAGDRFDEDEKSLGHDQVLTVRLAQQLKQAPIKLRGKAGSRIPNQRPIGRRSAERFSEDIRRFVRGYSGSMPRQVFLDCLESSVTIGLTTILGGSAEVLFHWIETGEVLRPTDQRPPPLLVDCSRGLDWTIRRHAEDSMDDFTRRLSRLPEILMALRLLDYTVWGNRRTKTDARRTPSRPDPSDWIRLLGKILHGRHEGANSIHERLYEYGQDLADTLDADHPEIAAALRDEGRQSNAVRRLATGLTRLMGRGVTTGRLFIFLDSGAGVGGPNALVHKRRTTRGTDAASGPRSRQVRSLVFGDSMLEYLVHRHLLNTRGKQRPLSVQAFLRVIQTRYGFHVDTPPRHFAVSGDLLQRNRSFLERRLRDLGLLRGVNDAESMKRLRPRFTPGAAS